MGAVLAREEVCTGANRNGYSINAARRPRGKLDYRDMHVHNMGNGDRRRDGGRRTGDEQL